MACGRTDPDLARIDRLISFNRIDLAGMTKVSADCRLAARARIARAERELKKDLRRSRVFGLAVGDDGVGTFFPLKASITLPGETDRGPGLPAADSRLSDQARPVLDLLDPGGRLRPPFLTVSIPQDSFLGHDLQGGSSALAAAIAAAAYLLGLDPARPVFATGELRDGGIVADAGLLPEKAAAFLEAARLLARSDRSRAPVLLVPEGGRAAAAGLLPPDSLLEITETGSLSDCLRAVFDLPQAAMQERYRLNIWRWHNPRQAIEVARQLTESGCSREALDLFDNLERASGGRLNRRDAVCLLLRRGVALNHLGRGDEAAALFATAREHLTGSYLPRHERQLLSIHQCVSALDELDHPTAIWLPGQLAGIERSLRRESPAHELLPHALGTRALALAMLGRHAEALKARRAAVAWHERHAADYGLHADFARTLSYLIWEAARAGRHRLSEEAFRRSEALLDGLPPGRERDNQATFNTLYRARALLAAGRAGEAEAFLDERGYSPTARLMRDGLGRYPFCRIGAVRGEAAIERAHLEGADLTHHRNWLEQVRKATFAANPDSALLRWLSESTRLAEATLLDDRRLAVGTLGRMWRIMPRSREFYTLAAAEAGRPFESPFDQARFVRETVYY